MFRRLTATPRSVPLPRYFSYQTLPPLSNVWQYKTGITGLLISSIFCIEDIAPHASKLFKSEVHLSHIYKFILSSPNSFMSRQCFTLRQLRRARTEDRERKQWVASWGTRQGYKIDGLDKGTWKGGFTLEGKFAPRLLVSVMTSRTHALSPFLMWQHSRRIKKFSTVDQVDASQWVTDGQSHHQPRPRKAPLRPYQKYSHIFN